MNLFQSFKKFICIATILLFAIELHAQTAEEYYSKASQLYDSLQYEKALAEITIAIEIDSLNISYLLFQSSTYLMLGKKPEALQSASKAAMIEPESYRPYFQLGNIYLSIGEMRRAQIYLKKSKGFCTDSLIKSSICLNLAVCYISERKFEEAETILREAIELDANNMDAYFNLATILDDLKKYDEAELCYKKIIDLDPENIYVYNNLGFFYQQIGRYKESIQCFNKVIDVYPDEAYSYNNRAYSYMKLGKLKKALTDVNLSITLLPENAFAYRNRALIYFEMERSEDACQDLQKALDLGFTKYFGNEVEELIKQKCVQ